MFSLTGFGCAFDQVLGFLQAQAGDLADDLDDVDLLGGIEAVEDDRELGLLGGLRPPRPAAAAGAAITTAAARPA